MNRKSYCSVLALVASTLIFSTLTFLTSCSSSSTTTTPPPPTVTITATGSTTPQSVAVGTAFTALQATVATGGTPTSGVTVTVTSPAATDGTFAGAALTATATTNASGVATAAFTAGTKAGTYTVTATAPGATASASFSLTNTAGAAANLTATSGTPQNVVVSATAAPLVANVTDGDGNPVKGVSVTFTAPTTGSTGTFTSTTSNTEIDTTDANGNATASDFVANATVGGPYNVVASSTGLTSVNFVLTNTAVVVAGTNYSFYLSGADTLPVASGNYDFLALAGAVTIDATGKVLGGVQDYNDASTAFGGVTSPEPGGDKITGGMLTVSASTGQGTLTLVTNNASVGVSGTETLGVQFVNTKHALIISFDGTATSSGSMDVQTLPSTLGGGFAFTTSGVDSGYNPTATAGVFTITGTSVAGVTDQNDNSAVTLNQAFTGTLSTPDIFGRGALTITGSSSLINYYIVGPEAVRIIGVDKVDASVGSAFGQGTGTFTNASLGKSVLALAGNSFVNGFGGADALAQFSTSSTSSNPADFTGVGDDNELVNGVQSTPASAIKGTYTIASNGYGSLTITNAGLGDVSTLGIYMTDPALNLNDPNNTATGLGGGLVLDMDAVLAGVTGILTPQTDTTAANFAGNYAVGAQDFNSLSVNCADCELDMVAQGTMTAGGALSLTGLVSDPFLTLTAGTTSTGDTFSVTPTPDATNAGRYSSFALAATINAVPVTFDVVIYQADGTQLYWLEDDASGVWIGPITQQGSLAGLPLARKPAAKTQTKPKR